MNALAFLQSPALAQLVRALPAPHRVSNVRDWKTVVSVVPHRDFDVAVIDPSLGGEHLTAERIRALVNALGSSPGTPLVAYVSVTASSILTAQAMARLVPAHVSNVVVRGIDDTPESLSSIMSIII